jgi:REP element-mobilizing transposase RayT
MDAEPAYRKPRSHTLRKGRHSQANRIYHLRTSTHQRRPFFVDFHLGRLVVHTMRFLHERGDVESQAFVVMPDHLHWLAALKGQGSLDALMHSLKRHSARAINQRLGRQGGAVWQKGYFDRALRAEEDVRAVARYIVANPLRAGLCRHVNDYPLWDAIWL